MKRGANLAVDSLATRFKPGQSGNPCGRKKGIAALARIHTDRALEILANALEDPDPRVSVVAAKELLDRGWGKPVAMTADVTNRLDDWDDDALAAALDAVRAIVGDRAAPLERALEEDQAQQAQVILALPEADGVSCPPESDG